MGHTGVPILSIEVVSMLGTLIHTKFKKIKNGKNAQYRIVSILYYTASGIYWAGQTYGQCLEKPLGR